MLGLPKRVSLYVDKEHVPEVEEMMEESTLAPQENAWTVPAKHDNSLQNGVKLRHEFLVQHGKFGRFFHMCVAGDF